MSARSPDRNIPDPMLLLYDALAALQKFVKNEHTAGCTRVTTHAYLCSSRCVSTRNVIARIESALKDGAS